MNTKICELMTIFKCIYLKIEKLKNKYIVCDYLRLSQIIKIKNKLLVMILCFLMKNAVKAISLKVISKSVTLLVKASVKIFKKV